MFQIVLGFFLCSSTRYSVMPHDLPSIFLSVCQRSPFITIITLLLIFRLPIYSTEYILLTARRRVLAYRDDSALCDEQSLVFRFSSNGFLFPLVAFDTGV